MSVIDLGDRHVLVIGAGSGGIGSATVVGALDAGARVTAVDIRNEAMDDLRALPSADRLHTTVADVCAAGDIADAVAYAIEHHGPIDGLVNIVGGTNPNEFGALLDLDPATVEGVMQRNLGYVFTSCAAVARSMIDTGRAGAMVNVSSVASFFGAPFLAPYTAANAGVNALTRTLANEWGPFGIKVNAIAPGSIQSYRHPEPPDAETLSRIPLGRKCEPAEIALPIVFLLSDAARFVTGQVLTVDGGATTRPPWLGSAPVPYANEASSQQALAAWDRSKEQAVAATDAG